MNLLHVSNPHTALPKYIQWIYEPIKDQIKQQRKPKIQTDALIQRNNFVKLNKFKLSLTVRNKMIRSHILLTNYCLFLFVNGDPVTLTVFKSISTSSSYSAPSSAVRTCLYCRAASAIAVDEEKITSGYYSLKIYF